MRFDGKLAIAIVLALGVMGLTGCASSSKTARKSSAAPPSSSAPASAAPLQTAVDAPAPGERRVGLAEVFELKGSEQVFVDGAALHVGLVKTGWTEVEGPEGTSRSAWARLVVLRGDASKNLVVDEGDTASAFGFVIELRAAGEAWNEASASYESFARLVVHRP